MIAIVIAAIVFLYFWLFKKKIVKMIDKQKILSEDLVKMNRFNKENWLGYITKNNKILFKMKTFAWYNIQNGKKSERLYFINVIPTIWHKIPNPIERQYLLIISANNCRPTKFGKNIILDDYFTLSVKERIIYNISDKLVNDFLYHYRDTITDWIVDSGSYGQLQRNTIVELSPLAQEKTKQEKTEFDKNKLTNQFK